MTYTRTTSGSVRRSAPATRRAALTWLFISRCRTASRARESATRSRSCCRRMCSACQQRPRLEVASARSSGRSGDIGRGTTAARSGVPTSAGPPRGRTTQARSPRSMATDLELRIAVCRTPHRMRSRSVSPRRDEGGETTSPERSTKTTAAPDRTASHRSSCAVPPVRAARCNSSTSSARRASPSTVLVPAPEPLPCMSRTTTVHVIVPMARRSARLSSPPPGGLPGSTKVRQP